MELKKVTKDNLRDVMESYKTDIMDAAFYQKVLSLINKDEAFDGRISFEIINNYREWAFVDMLTGIGYFNPNKMINYVNEMTKYYQKELSENDFRELKKMYYLFSVLHEIVHIEQSLMLREDYSKYDELNRMYREIFTKLNGKGSILAKIMYRFFAETFSFERNANITAYRELFDIYEDSSVQSTITANYVCELLSGYKDKKNVIISPVEDTMKKVGVKYDINHEGIPFDVRIESGLPVEADEYNKIYDEVEGKEIGEIDFRRLRKVMR